MYALSKELLSCVGLRIMVKSAHSTKVKQNILALYLVEPQMCTNTEGTNVFY